MTAYVHGRPANPFLLRAALVLLSLLAAAWIAWVALLAALIAVPLLALTGLIARLSRGPLPQRARRFDGAVIDAEYRVIPPER